MANLLMCVDKIMQSSPNRALLVIVSFLCIFSVGPTISLHPGFEYNYFVMLSLLMCGLALACVSFKYAKSEVGRVFSGSAFFIHVTAIGIL